MYTRLLRFLLAFLLLPFSQQVLGGPVRVLFLGHESEHHNSNLFYPMIQQALGREAIWFDYATSVGEALDDPSRLGRFDALLLYANHAEITPEQWENLSRYVEDGGGFVPVHCASWCFADQPGFDQLVGGRFHSHRSGVFRVRTVAAGHPAIRGVPELEAWDETYVHHRHNPVDRIVLQVRDAQPGDPHTVPEPWTWVRTQGKGRVFYTASGHDERVWSRPEFHQMLRKGILWAVGEERLAGYRAFLEERAPLRHQRRSDIPNYERRPEPLPYQLPLPAAESMKHTRVPVGYRLELFAAEPQIVNPIAIAWDERGRLWVAESVDYPNEILPGRKGNDRIRILEDTDGDGRADRGTVFAEGLNIPTSLLPVGGGVIVAHAPDMIFLGDVDGDDRADVRQVLNTGWGIGDTHAGPSNLRYGFDNRIWGTVGYSGYRSEARRFGQGVFAMDVDGGDVTFLHQFNNNTWGLGFNAAGDVFGSTANNNPSFFCGFPATGYRGGRGMTARMIADSAAFHPVTPNIRQVDAFGNYTAAAGHALATSDAFPPSWRDSMAFVCGPTGHLLGGYRMIPDGSGYRARNAFSLVASADEWFSPVAAEVGPDGHLWIADWYNFIIQHNPTPSANRGGYDAGTGAGNAHVNPNRDRMHGRIYRMVPDRPVGTVPRRSLAGAAPEDLIAALSDANLFWRLQAQRLLVESGTAPLARLRQLVVRAEAASVHALWTLHGLGRLEHAEHQAALLSGNPVLRRNAIRALGTGAGAEQLLFDTAVVVDPDLMVRREAFVKLAHLETGFSEVLRRALPRLMADPVNRRDPWLFLALKALAGHHGSSMGERTWGPNLLANPSFEEGEGDAPSGWSPHFYSSRNDSTVFTVATGESGRRSGDRALRIESVAGADAGWRTRVEIRPDTEYLLSGWIRTRGVRGAMGALFNIHGMEGALSRALRGDSDWTRVEFVFDSADRDSVIVNALFGGWGRSTGVAWYDDVSLREAVHQPESGADEPPPEGDARRGRVLFTEHAVASCIRCHRVGGRGGLVGPGLDGIALRRTPESLRQSLLDPQAVMADGYPAEVSPMPPFGVLLEPAEIADLLAFLRTLTTPPGPEEALPPPPLSFE